MIIMYFEIIMPYFSGSRITQVTEQLEKLVAVEKSLRDMEQLRYVTLKMYQLLQTHGLLKLTVF